MRERPFTKAWFNALLATKEGRKALSGKSVGQLQKYFIDACNVQKDLMAAVKAADTYSKSLASWRLTIFAGLSGSPDPKGEAAKAVKSHKKCVAALALIGNHLLEASRITDTAQVAHLKAVTDVFRTVERFLFAFSHDYCEKIKIANQELAKFRSSDEYDPEEIDDNKEHMSQYNG